MEIEDIDNNKLQTECLGCSIANGDYSPPGGIIYPSKNFTVNQDCEIPINGFLIISTNRHVQSIDEFTHDERIEFIDLLSETRKGMRQILDVRSIFLVQAENMEHHFHICLLPITDEMTKNYGTGFKAIKPYMEYARNNLRTKENVSEIKRSIEKMRIHLGKKF
jgi:diadenosine tetraphosphate (Ap4A) HIT family hydrolase